MGLHILTVSPESFLLVCTKYGRCYFVVAICGLCLFLTVPLVCLQSLIVVLPGGTCLISNKTKRLDFWLTLALEAYDLMQYLNGYPIFHGYSLDASQCYASLSNHSSSVGNVSGYRCVSDCRSRGREFDPGPVPYFCGDWSWNHFYGYSPPFLWFIQKGLLSVTSESVCTNYWLAACSSLPRKKCG